jgi:predicted NAD-dependent protein-ADP-ribosyltransferase YbiA (DUF1768 family)
VFGPSTSLSNKLVVNFNSNTKGPLCRLSNFFESHVVDVTRKNVVYPSAEHYFQSMKCVPAHRKHFYVDGKLGSWAGAFQVLTDDPERWRRKQMIGIIAKMAVEPNRAKKLGIVLKTHKKSSKRVETYEEACKTWLPILRSKFKNRELATVLQSTGPDSYLLNQSDPHRDQNCRCGGHIDSTGKMSGSNWMGRMMAQIRTELFLGQETLSFLKRTRLPYPAPYPLSRSLSLFGGGGEAQGEGERRGDRERERGGEGRERGTGGGGKRERERRRGGDVWRRRETW